jgi:phage shock protein C
MNDRTGEKLYRSARDKKLAGVCGGIGVYLDIDPTLIRLAWIVLTILTGIVPGVIGYIIAAIIMPREPL